MQKVIEHLGEVLLVIAIITVLIGVGVYVAGQVGDRVSNEIDDMSTTVPDWEPSGNSGE